MTTFDPHGYVYKNGYIRRMEGNRAECNHCMWLSTLCMSEVVAAAKLDAHMDENHPFAKEVTGGEL